MLFSPDKKIAGNISLRFLFIFQINIIVNTVLAGGNNKLRLADPLAFAVGVYNVIVVGLYICF